MRYFMTVTPSPEYMQGKAPPQALMEAMGPFMQKAIENGTLISTAGLYPIADAISLRAQEGGLSVIDGPFSESKEMIGGYAVMELPSKEAAIQAARDFLNLHIENGMADMQVQIRPIEGGYNF